MTPHEYLNDAVSYLERILRYTVDGHDAFLEDERTQDAVIRVYEVIGEIAKRLPQDIRDKAPQIDWRKLIGFRDFLAHNYNEVILDFVWNAVEDAPQLLALLKSLLQSLPEE
jgi:uncharacterized protein with HEPN domain